MNRHRLPEPIQTTGDVHANAYHDKDGKVTRYEFEWKGGDVIGVSEEMLDYLGIPFYKKIWVVNWFGFKTQILLYCPALKTIYCLRLNDKPNVNALDGMPIAKGWIIEKNKDYGFPLAVRRRRS